MRDAFDLHIHTKYSFDCFMEPQEIIKTAKKIGLRGIAITDHNTIKGLCNIKKYSDAGLIIIGGVEVSSEIGDICGLFINEEIKPNSALEIIDEIHNQGGLAVLPHPFRSFKSKVSPEILIKIDAIEVFNSRTKLILNKMAYEFAIDNKIPITAGSDAHFIKEIGLAKIFLDKIYTEEDIKKSILEGNSFVEGLASQFHFKIGSRINANIKKGNMYKIPYTIIKSIIKNL